MAAIYQLVHRILSDRRLSRTRRHPAGALAGRARPPHAPFRSRLSSSATVLLRALGAAPRPLLVGEPKPCPEPSWLALTTKARRHEGRIPWLRNRETTKTQDRDKKASVASSSNPGRGSIRVAQDDSVGAKAQRHRRSDSLSSDWRIIELRDFVSLWFDIALVTEGLRCASEDSLLQLV